MNCAYAPSSPVEAPFLNNHNFSKSIKNQTPQTISFSSQFPKLPISIRNTSSSNKIGSKSRVQALYIVNESTESLYELLGITETGTFSDIKKAYKQMARKYHPDVSPPERVDEYTKRFIMVQQAYETLSDPHSRASYDRDLGKGSSYAAFSARTRPYHYNYNYNNNNNIYNMEEMGEWKIRWNSQLDELKQRNNNMNVNARGVRMTWGSRMRNQR